MLTLFEIDTLFNFCVAFFWFITSVRFIPAPDVSTTEGNKCVSIFENFNALFCFCYNLLALMITVRFIPAPDISTAEGNKCLRVIANSITFLCWCCNISWPITTVGFIFNPEISTSEGIKFVNTIWIIILCFIFPLQSFLINDNCAFYSSSRYIHYRR